MKQYVFFHTIEFTGIGLWSDVPVPSRIIRNRTSYLYLIAFLSTLHSINTSSFFKQICGNIHFKQFFCGNIYFKQFFKFYISNFIQRHWKEWIQQFRLWYLFSRSPVKMTFLCLPTSFHRQFRNFLPYYTLDKLIWCFCCFQEK